MFKPKLILPMLILFALVAGQAVATFAQAAQPASPQAARPLAPGQVIDRAIAPGEKHIYEIKLAADQCLEFIVDQRGVDQQAVDVALAVVGLDGNKLVVVNSWRAAPESLLFIAEAEGTYRIELFLSEPDAQPGRYQATLAPLRPATQRDRDILQANQLILEANSLAAKVKFEEALPKVELALLLREKAFGPFHLEVAATLNMMGRILEFKNEFVQGEALYQRALTIEEQTLGLDHIDLARVLNDLAALNHSRGDYTQARQLYLRALTIREKWLGLEHITVATVLNNLANLCGDEGDYAQAELLQQRTLAIREKKLGAEHPSTGASYTNLGILYEEKGDYAQAEALLQRALPIFEQALGSDHPNVALLLYHLGVVADRRENDAQAERFYQKSLMLFEKSVGANHTFVALALYGLAGLHAKTGNDAQAETEYQRAMAIREKVFGPEHPDVAATLNKLGQLYLKHGQRDLPQAEAPIRRALEILEKSLGDHPKTAQTLDNLAQLYRAKGDLQQALACASRAGEMRERHIQRNLLPGSERQKLDFLNLFAGESDRLIALHTQFAPHNPQALSLAFTTLLRRKGRGLDALSNNIAVLRSRALPQDQSLFMQLATTRAQLAALTFKEPGKDVAIHRSRLKQLETETERLEAELGSRSAEFRAQSRPITLEAVQSALPQGATLVEFALYRPDDGAAERPTPPRYAAYLLSAQGQAQWADLGVAADLDAAINAWRAALRDPKRADTNKLGRAVSALLLQPLQPLLAGAQHLLISPDGALNLIPFEALPTTTGHYLVERFAISYLTSGRDLLRLQQNPSSVLAGVRAETSAPNPPLVIADPLFGEPITLANAAAPAQVGRMQRRRSVTTGSTLNEVYFAPLFGTAQEARTIKTLFNDATLLTGAQATEAALKQVHAPRLLHIATHGFFLADAASHQTDRINPLLRSGLALAEANLRNQNPSGEDGILTALEAAGLNLWGTRLVTLSACDTGLGEVRNGEGVYGLRRAFALAGAETLVMSLWPVSDVVTRELMTSFYTNLRQGAGRGAALRAAQLKMLRRPDRRAPAYWASFIQAGEWGGLNGAR